MHQLRIGFAFNQKPADDADTASSDEPPSSTSDEPPGPRTHDRFADHDRFAEWDAPATIDAVAAALARAGTVIRLEANEEFPARLHAARPDIVFNIAEGLNGPNREAHVPAICEFFGVPHTASDPLTLALAHHKARAKEVFAAHGVATPAWTIAYGAEAEAKAEATMNAFASASGRSPLAVPLSLPVSLTLPGRAPWIVKPVHEGSSMGIAESSLCHDAAAVAARVHAIDAQYAQPALIEAFLPGREFTIAIIGNGAEAHALPIVEIALNALPAGAAPIYGYEAKWLWDVPEQPLPIFECPAELDGTLARSIEDVALRAYHALGCRDWSRVDVRLDGDGVPHVLEINPLPGILPDPRQNSCFPKAARAAGMDYDTLILSVLDVALRRTGLRA